MINLPDMDHKMIESKTFEAVHFKKLKPQSFRSIMNELGIREAT